MQAVCNRAYQAATVVLDVAKRAASVMREDRSEVNQEVRPASRSRRHVSTSGQHALSRSVQRKLTCRQTHKN